MIYYEILNHQAINKEWWNTLVSSTHHGTIFQTTFWADYLKEYLGYTPLYLVFKDDNNVMAICLAFIRALRQEIFFERKLIHRSLPLIKDIFPELLWQEGPVLLTEDPKSQRVMLTFFLQSIADFLKKEQIAQLAWSEFPILENLDSLVDNNLGFIRKEWATYLVEVNKDEDILCRSLKRAARKAINKALRDQISVRRITDLEELERVYHFLKTVRQAKGIRTYSFANQALMWKHLRPAGCVERFVAFYGDRIIATLGIWHYNGILTEFSSVQSPLCYKKKLYGGDLIKWEVIRWAKKKGYRFYNLAGISPNPGNDKEKGIKRFKEKWGGIYKEYYLYGFKGPLSIVWNRLLENARTLKKREKGG